MAYSIDRMPERISIGRETETGVTDVMIDCGAWVSKWPGMALHAIHTPEGGAPYILQTETDGGVLVWHVTDADTATPGTGRMEIVGETDGQRKVSAMVKVSVAARMGGTVGEPPEAAKPWADRVVEASERITGMQAQATTLDAGSSATAAWDGEQGLLTIGVPKGEKGEKGDTGPQGPNGVQGPQGEKGADGKDAVVDATLTKSGQAADAKATGDALALKLTEPSTGLAVGKYFRIAAIDDSGHAVLEAVDLPIAADNRAGVVQVSAYDGWHMYGNRLQARTIESANFAGTNNTAVIGKGTLNSILSTPSVMPPLTAEEQAAARERMNAHGSYKHIATITIDEDGVSNVGIDRDENGMGFSFADVYIYGYIGKTVGSSFTAIAINTITTTVNGSNNIIKLSSNYQANGAQFELNIKKSKYWRAYAVSTFGVNDPNISGMSGSTSVSHRGASNVRNNEWETLTALAFATDGTAFGIGTTFDIWGR